MSSKMTVKKEAIMARFGGMGFHNSEANVWREMDDVQFNQYVGKVYRELSPGFSRMWGGFPEWTKEEMDAFAEYCEKMQCKVGATIYLTGHCVRYETDEELTAYASNVADRLEYLIYEKGLSNVKIYCMSNELSLDDWGDLAFEMATFKNIIPICITSLRTDICRSTCWRPTLPRWSAGRRWNGRLQTAWFRFPTYLADIIM